MTEEQNKLADRLEAMLHQVGHPDYSLREFYEGLKLIVWELRQEREPATEAVRDAVLEEAACMAESGQTETVELVPGNFRIERSRPATGKEIAAAIRALKGKGASQGADDMVMPEREALAFFVATAFGDGFFDDDQGMKERVRAWLLNSANKIREDITIEEVVESLLAASSDEQKG